MNRRTLTALAATTVVALTLTVMTAAPAMAGSFHAELTEPVAIGDQVFAAGEMKLVQMRKTNVVAIRIEGKQVAQIWLEPAAPSERSRDLQVRLERDTTGLLHLTAIDCSKTPSVRTDTQVLKLASLAKGMTSVPDYRNRLVIISVD